jgi:hypothetical protein
VFRYLAENSTKPFASRKIATILVFCSLLIFACFAPQFGEARQSSRNAEAARILMICVRVRHHVHRPLFDQGASPLFATVRFDLV